MCSFCLQPCLFSSNWSIILSSHFLSLSSLGTLVVYALLITVFTKCNYPIKFKEYEMYSYLVHMQQSGHFQPNCICQNNKNKNVTFNYLITFFPNCGWNLSPKGTQLSQWNKYKLFWISSKIRIVAFNLWCMKHRKQLMWKS